MQQISIYFISRDRWDIVTETDPGVRGDEGFRLIFGSSVLIKISEGSIIFVHLLCLAHPIEEKLFIFNSIAYDYDRPRRPNLAP